MVHLLFLEKNAGSQDASVCLAQARPKGECTQSALVPLIATAG